MTKEQAVASIREYYRSDIAREIVTAIEEDLAKDMTSNFNDSLLVRLGVAREAAVRKVVAWIMESPLISDHILAENIASKFLSAPAEPPVDYCPSCRADTQHGYKPAAGRCDRCGHTTPPAAEADPRMTAIAYGQSDEHRERFLREKQPPSPTEPPADDWCKCPIKTKGEITLTYHPIGGHAAPLLDGFRCQHCNRRVEAFHKAAPASKACD